MKERSEQSIYNGEKKTVIPVEMLMEMPAKAAIQVISTRGRGNVLVSIGKRIFYMSDLSIEKVDNYDTVRECGTTCWKIGKHFNEAEIGLTEIIKASERHEKQAHEIWIKLL